MMDCFVVFVQPRYSIRYVDSVFIKEDAAAERMEQLKESLDQSGHVVRQNDGSWVWFIKSKIEDAALPADGAGASQQATPEAKA